MKNWLHLLLLKIVTECSLFIAKFNVPFTNKKMSSKDYRDIQAIIQPGFIMLSAKYGELSNIFIPGDYGHAVIVKDKYTVIEATTKNVVETDLIDFVMTKDSIVILMPYFASVEQMKGAVEIAGQQIGKPYDYSMEFSASNVKSFYCSELVYYSYLQACGRAPFPLKEILGITSVSPQDFLEHKNQFALLYRK